jgi:osmotically-inducible protein OsmY
LDPISKLARSLALVRRQPGTQGAATTPGGDKAATGAQAARPSRAASAPTGDLRQRVAAGLAALSEADRASHDRPVAVFVEQVLLHEWGASFRESAQYRQTARRVAKAMKGDPQVRAELESLLNELVAEGRK